MKKAALFLVLFLLNINTIFSQEKIIESFQKNALYREKVFIQLNKSIYFTNENVWFTAFVAVDGTNIPSEYTSNLHVNLLNEQGVVLDSKNIFIKKGVGAGEFLISGSTPSGMYYIQGFTNFMQNFGDKNVFLQKIEIINPLQKAETNKQYTNKYDIQLFPESGYLLEDVENKIGIKALINGKGFPFTGKIIDKKGEEITTFTGNKFGMGTAVFNYLKGEVYTAIIKINNTTQKVTLPKAKKTGIIFSVDNLSYKDVVKLTLKTNVASSSLFKNDFLEILIYRNNTISEAVTLTLYNTEKTSQEIFFDKNKMQNGVNVATLFKNNQPIAERKFFIDKPSEQTAVLVEELKTENDSIQFKISTINSNLEPVSANLSVSVLPKESKSFYEDQSIQTAFLLTPYIKGTVENPSYYFQSSSSKRKEDLDVLLLNQGWAAYTLEEKIKEINPEKTVNFESGFSINGEIKKVPKGYDIGLLSKKNRLTAFSEFNQNKQFTFENVFAYKNDSVKIALIKKGAVLMKPTQVNFLVAEQPIQKYKNLISPVNNPILISENTLKNRSLKGENFPETEELETVKLKTVIATREKTIYDEEHEIAYKRKVIAPDFYQNKKVTAQMGTNFQTVLDYFKSFGYIKRTDRGRLFISLRNAPVTFFGQSKNNDNTYPPRIYLDDVALDRDGDLEMLGELRMADIDEILINKSGAGGGADGTGGIIKIYRKKGDHQYFDDKEKNRYEILVLKTGFDRAANYYKPQYNMYNKEVFNWSEIDWINSIKTDKKGEAFIKIPTNEFSNEFQFIINGFSENGLLFHTIYKTGKIVF